MSSYRVNTSEVRELEKRIGSFMSPSDRRKLATELADVLVDQTDKNFKKKRDPDGQPWAPWSTSYARSGRGRFLLDRTGQMRRSVRKGRTGFSLVEVKADFPADLHMEGTRDMPARKFMGFGSDEITAVEAHAVQFMKRVLHERRK